MQQFFKGEKHPDQEKYLYNEAKCVNSKIIFLHGESAGMLARKSEQQHVYQSHLTLFGVVKWPL